MSSDNILTLAESKKLAKRLKQEDPDQFHTLVRMHLSFVLDLNVDETEAQVGKCRTKNVKWGGLVNFSKKLKGPNKSVTDGLLIAGSILPQVNVLVEFLTLEENLKQEGIFRRSGKLTRQHELKGLLSKGIKVDFSEGQFSVHDCASVLKMFLSDMPEPLLSEAHYPAYCQLADVYTNDKWTETRMLRAIQLLLLLLPSHNRTLVKKLLHLLNQTSSLAASNRMTSENLATLFTPHLLCPRKLSPEVLHTNAQNLACIVVFMINGAFNLFEVPAALTTDIKAYWEERRRTPDNILEHSVTEGMVAAKTVFSFVDRERTAQENTVNQTETALAQLYAHIQSLPESSKKRRLIKQFNKENGYGTPRSKASIIPISLKKTIFTKSQKKKDLDESGVINCDAILSSPVVRKVRQKLLPERMTREDRWTGGSTSGGCLEIAGVGSTWDQGNRDNVALLSCVLTSTPASGTSSLSPNKTPSPSTRPALDMSPITRSTQRMPKAMQEAMVTPRSRRPVVALSGSSLCHLSVGQDSESGSSLTSDFKDYLFSRSVLTSSPVDHSFSSQTGDFDPWESGGEDPAAVGDQGPLSSPPAKRRLSSSHSPITETSL